MAISPDEISVVTANGLKGKAPRAPDAGYAGGKLVCVTLESGRQLWVAPEMLLHQPAGHYLLPVAVSDQDPPGPADSEHLETMIVPILEETVDVRKHEVQTGGVRVSKVVRERRENVAMETMRERVDVRREAVNQFVSEPEAARQDGEVTIIPIYEEVVVVEKRLRLKERWIITKQREAHMQSEPVVLRREEVMVEPLGSRAEVSAVTGAPKDSRATKAEVKRPKKDPAGKKSGKKKGK